MVATPARPTPTETGANIALQAQRAAVRETIGQKVREREQRAAELGQSFGPAGGLGLGLDR